MDLCNWICLFRRYWNLRRQKFGQWGRLRGNWWYLTSVRALADFKFLVNNVHILLGSSLNSVCLNVLVEYCLALLNNFLCCYQVDWHRKLVDQLSLRLGYIDLAKVWESASQPILLVYWLKSAECACVLPAKLDTTKRLRSHSGQATATFGIDHVSVVNFLLFKPLLLCLPLFSPGQNVRIWLIWRQLLWCLLIQAVLILQLTVMNLAAVAVHSECLVR